MNNQDDLRKTVKNKTSQKKKGNNKAMPILLLLIIIVAVILIVRNAKGDSKVSVQEVTNYNYFVVTVNEKSGVIDKEGKIIINPEYDSIQIPNPEKPIFVCLYDYNSETREYSSDRKSVV